MTPLRSSTVARSTRTKALAETQTGGIVYIRARTISIKSGGVIQANGYGFDQGDSWDGWSNWSYAGDSECHTQRDWNNNSNNCSGGGGGYAHSCCCGSNNYGAGGGGNRTAGEAGRYHNSNNYDGGQGGAAKASMTEPSFTSVAAAVRPIVVAVLRRHRRFRC